jgi:hypothetical protein
MTGQSDVNHDGYPDLVLFFRTQQMTALQQMDSRLRGNDGQKTRGNDETVEAVLYGTTYGGQRIRGSGTVRIVPPAQASPGASPSASPSSSPPRRGPQSQPGAPAAPATSHPPRPFHGRGPR